MSVCESALHLPIYNYIVIDREDDNINTATEIKITYMFVQYRYKLSF